ncbi:MAG: hypothetical protein MZU97_07000 [Bacillus subtilis]|nr:hypothetical protein [Bacillus subtilis]
MNVASLEPQRRNDTAHRRTSTSPSSRTGEGLMSKSTSRPCCPPASTDRRHSCRLYATVFLVMTILVSFLGNIVLLAGLHARADLDDVAASDCVGFLRFKKAVHGAAPSLPSPICARCSPSTTSCALPEWAFMILVVVSVSGPHFIVIRELFDRAYQYLNLESSASPDAGAPSDPDEPEDEDRTRETKRPAGSDEDDNDDDRS